MSPFALLSFFLLFVVPHPHVPKAIVMHGAGGKVATVTWFTVPYNAEQVKTLVNGNTWHLGFAMLQVERAMRCGDVAIPACDYKLNVLRDKNGEFSELQLEPIELARARPSRRGQEADPERLAAVQKELKAKGIPELIRLPVRAYDEENAEHLEFLVINRGYEAVKRFTSDPKGGAAFTLMTTFGDLHRRIDLQEVFESKTDDKK